MLALTATYRCLPRLVVLLCIVTASMSTWSAVLAKASYTIWSGVSAEVITAKMDEISKNAGLDQGTKAQLLELYRKSLNNLSTAAFYESLAQKKAQSLETAPAEITRLRAAIDLLNRQKGLPEDQSNISGKISTEKIEQQLLSAKAQYEAIEEEVESLARQADELDEEPLRGSTRLNEIQVRENAILAAVQTPESATVSSNIEEAQRWLQQTELQALSSEARQLKQKLVSMPLLSELATVQQEEAEGRLAAAGSAVHYLEAMSNRKLQEEAEQSVDATLAEIRRVANSPPILQQAAAKNTKLSDALQTVASSLKQVRSKKDALEKELTQIEAGIDNTRQKLALAGLSKALGFLLHEQLKALPDVRLLKENLAENQRMIIETGLVQLHALDERKQLDDPNGYIAQLTAGFTSTELADVEPELRKIFAIRGDLLNKLFAANQVYLGTLTEIEILYNQLLNAVTSFQGLLAERLLWIRSMPLFRFQELSQLPQETAAIFAPDQWLAAGTALAVRAGDSPHLILACLLTGVLLGYRKKMLARLATLIDRSSHSATYSFGLSLQALVLIILLSLSWPLLLFSLGWQLFTAVPSTVFINGLAIGLLSLSYRFLLLRILRTLLLPDGLAVRFFHWPHSTITVLRSVAGLMIAIFLPVVFFTQMAFYANMATGDTNALGRLSLSLSLAIAAVFLYRILHPRTGVWHGFVEQHAEHLIARLYPFIVFLIILLPVMLIGLAVAGYVFAIGSLLRCLINSVWLVMGLILCHQLVEQWLIQSSRRLFRKKALLEHEQAKVNQAPGHADDSNADHLIEETVEDLVELSTESRKLLRTATFLACGAGLWLVWGAVLPALSLFNEVILWHYSSVINGQTTVVPVSLGDVGQVVLIGIVTLTTSRHFPALLKISLLQNLKMPPGSRYTITTLSRYLIGGTGMLVIANILGFRWSQIQWLVAALGVGIGFGLQEIVANFISGLIILFERPLRVGDVVTIGSTDGVVTRIRIRATTIRDFDGKELLVPNKEFISGPLLNWSLTDPVLRIMLPVGIAYGSDVQAAMALMMESAAENALILVEPKPSVTFDSFGDNALLLTLRCFIGSVGDRIVAKSLLHQAIDRKFRKADICMSFPQRDVHLDAVKPLEVRIVEPDNDTPQQPLVPETPIVP
ncbi:MAG: mechanosensitive ion channel domain-containing protein [Desulfobulbus sp.]